MTSKVVVRWLFVLILGTLVTSLVPSKAHVRRSLGIVTSKRVPISRHVTTENDNSAELVNDDTDPVIEEFREELASLRGTPELVDRLENLIMKHPGIENNINLYRAIYPFPLDDFQEQGLQSLQSGNNVLVTTPTGSGKTVVGELAIYFALMLGLRVAYTTPLKALSNQKFSDFKKRYGGDRVSLLTGDIAINRGAPITV